MGLRYEIVSSFVETCRNNQLTTSNKQDGTINALKGYSNNCDTVI